MITLNDTTNLLNIQHIGYTIVGKERFATHFFNADMKEVAYFNRITKSGFLFDIPRTWSRHNLCILEYATYISASDLEIANSLTKRY